MVVALAAACADDNAPRTTPPTTTSPERSTGSDEPPARDLIDLAQRYRNGVNLPRQVLLPPPALGAEQEFDLLALPPNLDERPGRTTITATLRSVSEHAYFFVERDAEVEDDDLAAAVRVFEEEVWPAVTDAFGPPPIPGVDGDPHIVILHADLGSGIGGYVSDEDAYPREAVPHSNQREIVYLNLNIRPGSASYARVLAHELQHVIHRRLDADEEAWVNEGLSEIAAGLVGQNSGFFGTFLDRPDTQLNAWADLPSSAAHYGASGLFFDYLLEQSEGDVLQLAAEPADGVAGVEAFLQASGSDRSFVELVADWTIANFLDQPQGPYGYQEREVSAPTTVAIDELGEGERAVGQFAADYLEFRADDFESEPVFVFEGETEVPVLPAQTLRQDLSDASAFWWSNRGDNIDATLTRELDLTGVERATLTFRTWFDIERWFDYAHVAASRDGGQTWTALSGRQTTTDDPLEVSYGPGYTGVSGGGESPRWVDERIDLFAYVGSRMLLRFEYLTDDSLNKPGWAIDDIAVPEIGFFDDVEADAGGWRREGFRRLTELLPQRFVLRLITLGPSPAVETIALDGSNRAEISLTGLGSDYDRAVIVVMGATVGTTEPARYRYRLTAGPGE